MQDIQGLITALITINSYGLMVNLCILGAVLGAVLVWFIFGSRTL